MKKVLLSALRGYKRWIAPSLPRKCRYEPTCASYAYEAISRYGAGKGAVMAIKRICRCHPFHQGGIDPVP